MARTTIYGFLGLAFVIAQVMAHGHLSVPANRGYSHRQDENNAPVAYPLANDFVCRNDGSMPSSMWSTITAGKSVPVTWAMEAAHPGDCFAYISYDADKPDNQKKWFKVAQWDKCNMQNLQTMSFTLPSYLPSSEHAILRWEWYALHLRDINIVEFYAQCADVKIVGASNGQLPTPQVTIPGHLPMAAKHYRSDYKNPQLTLFTGPPVASIGGAAYNCESAYDNSCTVEPVTNNPCMISHQRCVSSTTYQACGIGATTTEWGAEQKCQTGLECFDHPDGIHIMCSWPRTSASTPAPTKAPTATPSPATQAPATQAPTKAPVTNAPATQAPATQAPVTQAPTTNPSSGGASCVVGHMRCAGDSSYEICSPKAANLNTWAAAQSCQTGLYCNADGSFVRCTSTKPAASTTAPTSAPTKTPKPSTAPTSAPTVAPTVPSGVCTAGYQQCVGGDGSNVYTTCVDTRNGPVWSDSQKCQAGLSCHQSTTANKIYCY